MVSPEKFLEDPQQMNTYSYVRNNPLNAIDPDGLLTVFVHGTFSSPATFSNEYKQQAMKYLNDDWSFDFRWSGGNSTEARLQA